VFQVQSKLCVSEPRRLHARQSLGIVSVHLLASLSKYVISYHASAVAVEFRERTLTLERSLVWLKMGGTSPFKQYVPVIRH